VTPGAVRAGRELSIAFQSDEDLAAYASLAPRIEELGFATVSVYSDLLYPSPLLPLITIARATRRIRLGPACLNPYLLHPVEIANQLHILDTVSGGRAYLGLAPAPGSTRSAWPRSGRSAGCGRPSTSSGTCSPVTARPTRARSSGSDPECASPTARCVTRWTCCWARGVRSGYLWAASWPARSRSAAPRIPGCCRPPARRWPAARRARDVPRARPAWCAGPSPWSTTTGRAPGAWPGPRSPCTCRPSPG
jgi:Luciferase-like monooxygenase